MPGELIARLALPQPGHDPSFPTFKGLLEGDVEFDYLQPRGEKSLLSSLLRTAIAAFPGL